MPYPVWDVGLGYGVVMAVVAVVHVFISHFAIGGGLYLVVSEHAARRKGDAHGLAFLERLSRLFVLVTLVLGALTGVGIWFVIGVLSPMATEALIHIFVWGWAVEWTFFVVEILAALLYYYGWKRMSAKAHLTLGWIYFAAAWLSLFVINGIITFMLTPGTWLESGTFFSAFFNPTFLSSLILRTGICILLAGLFALLVASSYPLSKLKRRLVRTNAAWALVGLAAAAACFLWYRAAIGEAVYETAIARFTAPVTSLAVLEVAGLVLAVAVVGAGLVFPRIFVQPVGVLLLAVGLVVFGAFEWFRESARKPYVIYDYMYGNGMRVDQQGEFRRSGLLERIAFRTGDDGADLWRHACRSCHTLDGYNPVKAALDHTDATYVEGLVRHVDQLHGRMPPFYGSDADARVLGAWLWERANQRPLADHTRLEGVELGAAVYALRCGRCHVIGGYNDKTGKMAREYDAELLADVLRDEEGLEGMPVMTGMPEKELEALLLFLRPHLAEGGE